MSVRLPAAVSTSPTVNANGPTACPRSSSDVASAEIVGRSFTAVTVRRKLVAAVAWPSLTVTVIVAVPL